MKNRAMIIRQALLRSIRVGSFLEGKLRITSPKLLKLTDYKATAKRLDSFVSLAATMRHLFICTLLCTLAIPALAQTTRPLPQPRQARRSDQARNSAQVTDWENRVMSKDPKVRASAETALVQGAGRSLPLLRRFLN